ncbi:MAG: 4-hydroxy-tetrahydrodipicolinate reductase [Bacteroidota bacterium]
MKIALIGYGKMGKIIDQLASQDGHEVVLRIDKDNQEEFTPEQLAKAEVAIEFSRPESAFDNIRRCLEAGLPLVSGTTGWLHHLEEAKQLASDKQTGFVYASNFSVGVNLFFILNEQLAAMMNPHPGYEVSMTEIHHTQKLDAPSGTAITLAEGILDKLDRKTSWVNQASQTSEELPIISERIDPTPGTHAIRYQSSIDEIEIVHTARSREGFARGAILAARWIIGKKGFYGMREVLGF